MKQAILPLAILLLTSCAKQNFPAVVDMPHCDANTTRPGIELTQVERTDSTTELTFLAMYDYNDSYFNIGDDICLWADDLKAPFKELKTDGNTKVSQNGIFMPQGVPVQFKMIFPAIPDDVASIDFVQKKNGKVMNSIWGIDLTGKISPNELPADVPAELRKFDMATGNIPQIVLKDGVAKITAHAVAWRDWMDNRVDFYINTIDGKQQKISKKFNKEGVATIEIPLNGTADGSAHTPYNTYSAFYVDPGEEINLYVLPDNNSEAQRFRRPSGIIDGKYHNMERMYMKLFFFQEYADTLLLDKTDPDNYFAAMMKIHNDGLDSIQARNFEPDLKALARARVDRRLMAHAHRFNAYISQDLDVRESAAPDSVLRFSPEQIQQIRSSIDFDNPLLEMTSVGGPGNRERFLQARKLILGE